MDTAQGPMYFLELINNNRNMKYWILVEYTEKITLPAINQYL